MTPLTRIAAEHVAGLPIVVRLRSNRNGDPVEVEGGGYKPLTLSGKVNESGIGYSQAVFLFTGPADKVCGWYATIGDEIVHPVEGGDDNGLFAESFFVGGKGDRIKIDISALARE